MPDLFERSQIVTFPTQLFFSIDKTAWYVISITARVRSEKQRGKQETDDEELTVELDRITFPKPSTNNNLAVIWLYHKAEIINQDGSRSWRSWPKAVTRYNGSGDSSYQEKVYEIYQKGDWK